MRLEGTSAELPALLEVARELEAARDALASFGEVIALDQHAAGHPGVADGTAAVARDCRVRRAVLGQQLGVLACFTRAIAAAFAVADGEVVTAVSR